MSITAKVMTHVGDRTKTEWTEVVTTDFLRIVTADGDEFDLTYVHGEGLKLSAKSDVLHLAPRATNVVVIRKSRMIDEMERR